MRKIGRIVGNGRRRRARHPIIPGLLVMLRVVLRLWLVLLLLRIVLLLLLLLTVGAPVRFRWWILWIALQRHFKGCAARRGMMATTILHTSTGSVIGRVSMKKVLQKQFGTMSNRYPMQARCRMRNNGFQIPQ